MPAAEAEGLVAVYDSKTHRSSTVAVHFHEDVVVDGAEPEENDEDTNESGGMSATRKRLEAMKKRFSRRVSTSVSFYMDKARRGSESGTRKFAPQVNAFAERMREYAESPGALRVRGMMNAWCGRESRRFRKDAKNAVFWRALFGEFLGTLVLVIIGCGAASSKMLGEELNVHSSAFTIKVSLAFGLTYTAVLFCLHHGNDGHLNSAVSLAMAVTRRIGVFRSLLYITAQLLGAILGAYALSKLNAPNDINTPSPNGVVNSPNDIDNSPLTDDDIDNNNNHDNALATILPLGYTVLAENVTGGQGFLVEFLSSFVLVFVVFSCYDDGTNIVDQETITVPFIVGLTLMACSLFAIPYTTGSMNTARSVGPAIIGNVWTSHWVYWFGPILGGISGGSFHDLLFYTNDPLRKILNKILPCIARFRSPATSESDESIHQYHQSPPDRIKNVYAKNVRETTRTYGSRVVDDSDESDVGTAKTKAYNNPSGMKYGDLLRQYDQKKKLTAGNSDDSREDMSGEEDDSDASTKRIAKTSKLREAGGRYENQELRAGMSEGSDEGDNARGNKRQMERLRDRGIGERRKTTVLKTGSSYTAMENSIEKKENITPTEKYRKTITDDKCEESVEEIESLHDDNDKKDTEKWHENNNEKDQQLDNIKTLEEDTELTETPVDNEESRQLSMKTAGETSDKDSITDKWEKVDNVRARTAGDSSDDDDSDRDISSKSKCPIQFGPGGVIIRPAKSPETTPVNETTPIRSSSSAHGSPRLSSVPVHDFNSQPSVPFPVQISGTTVPAYVPFDLLSKMSIDKIRPLSPSDSPIPDGIHGMSPGESPTDISLGHGLTPIKEMSFENGQMDSSPHVPFPMDKSISPRLEHDPTISPPAVSISLNTLITHDPAAITKKLTPDSEKTKKLTPDSDKTKKVTSNSDTTKKDTPEPAKTKKPPLGSIMKKKKPPETLAINQKPSDSAAAQEGDALKLTPSSGETTPLSSVHPPIRDPSSIILHPEGKVERPPFNKYAKDPLGLLSGYSSPTKTAVTGFVLVGIAKREPAQKSEADADASAVEAVVEKYVSDGEYSPLGGIIRSLEESTDDED